MRAHLRITDTGSVNVSPAAAKAVMAHLIGCDVNEVQTTGTLKQRSVPLTPADHALVAAAELWGLGGRDLPRDQWPAHWREREQWVERLSPGAMGTAFKMLDRRERLAELVAAKLAAEGPLPRSAFLSAVTEEIAGRQ